MKLYTVHFEFEFAVMADDEEEARSYLDKALNDSSGSYEDDADANEIDEFTGANKPCGWTDDCLVYGKLDKDTPLREAWEICDNNPVNIRKKEELQKITESQLSLFKEDK